MKTQAYPERGAVLVVALIAMAVLALVATAALYEVGNRHAVTYHSLSWNEALASAEVGADVALRAMNDSIVNPTTAWAAWTPSDATTFPKTWTPSLAPHAGDGNNKVFALVTVDDAITDLNGIKWMRVRSTGVAEVAGTCRPGVEGAVLDSAGLKNHRSVLRKTRFTTDLTSGALQLPQIARSIEVMAASQNARMLTRALAVRSSITLTGGASIDSFDSTDPSKSTSWLYDPAKRQDRADVASNADGALSDFNNCEVRGSAFCNGGAIQDTGGVVGPVFDNFATAIPPVVTPVWGIINVTPSVINDPAGGMTLVGGPSGSAQNYKVTAMTLNNAANPLVLAPHTVGRESYVNIWVTGAISVTGTGYIRAEPGVHVTIFCEGDITLQGGGIMNQNGRAQYLQVFGVDPPSGTRAFTIGGTGEFIGVINAPAFDLTLNGTGQFCGAAIARAATINSSAGFHYDESLADLNLGSPERYEFASWAEDIR
jgi:hypothetical protein